MMTLLYFSTGCWVCHTRVCVSLAEGVRASWMAPNAKNLFPAETWCDRAAQGPFFLTSGKQWLRDKSHSYKLNPPLPIHSFVPHYLS